MDREDGCGRTHSGVQPRPAGAGEGTLRPLRHPRNRPALFRRSGSRFGFSPTNCVAPSLTRTATMRPRRHLGLRHVARIGYMGVPLRTLCPSVPILLFTLSCGTAPSSDEPGSAPEPESFLSNIEQLTFGGQNAEAYWSPDGTRLVFQSTRGDGGCDQIYVMNADGTDQKMVSTGKGVTTCGYFLPDNRTIVYASTHLSGDDCPPRPDRSKGYVWPVHAGYDLFLTDLVGSEPRRITDTPGYDAEGTVNWETGRIVFTSMASGDLDLWSMNLDGSGKTRLSTAYGYDGGAFFSRDGSRLVMRANHPARGRGLGPLHGPALPESDRADEDGDLRRQRRRLGHGSPDRFRLRQLCPAVHSGRLAHRLLVQQEQL